jgi:hypothetical protein
MHKDGIIPLKLGADWIAWYDKNSNGKTHPVAQKKPNAFGLVFDACGENKKSPSNH